MRDPLFWVPIKYKLPLTFASLCLFALGIGGYVVASSAEQALEDQILLRLDELSEVTTIVVDRHLELLGRRVEDFASDGFIRTELVSLLASQAADQSDVTASTRARLVRHLIHNKLPLVDSFVDAFLLDRQGTPVLHVHSQSISPIASFATAAPWFGPLEAPTADHPYPSFLLSTPVTSLDGARQIGFLQILVRADVWASGMREQGGLPPSNTFRIWLEDEKGGTLLLLSESDRIQDDRLALSETASQAPVIEYTTTIPRNAWQLQLEVDRDPVMEPIRSLLYRIFFVGGILLLLIMIIWFFPAQFLLKPLVVLQDAARRIAEGDFSTRVAIDSRDEVGDLSRSFNIMAAAVEERTGELEKAAAVLKGREQDIRFERDRLNAVIDSMHDGLFFLDLKGQVTLSNAAAQPLVAALLREGVPPRPSNCRYENGEKENCLHCLASFDKPPQSCVVNVDSRRYEIHATTLSATGGQTVGRVFVSRDITERIAQAGQQAHQERMSVLGEIAASMAHELNNPLTAIAMFSQMLETELEPGSSFCEHAEVIRRNAESCKKTIRGLLDIATSAGSEVFSFNMHDLLHDVRHFLRPLYEQAKARLTIQADAKNVTVMGDELQLRQVIVNLVMNAIQAADNHEAIVTVRTDDRGDNLAILVSDTGSGIPADVRSHIFEPFFTTKPPGVGTGLGLPTSKRIVEAHGGTLELISSEAGCTVFQVLLPREDHPKFRKSIANPALMSRRSDETVPVGEAHLE